MIKKINAALGLFVGFLFIVHVTMMCIVMLRIVDFLPIFGIIGVVFLGAFCIHALISVSIMFFANENNIAYPKLNKSTVVQRITAIVLLITVHFHMTNYFVDGKVVPPCITGLITELLFACAFLLHFYPSIEKGFISLGIESRFAIVAYKVLISLAVIASIIVICIYQIGGMR